jgi:hypothetical protein
MYPTWAEIQAFVTGAGFSVFVAVFFMLKHDRNLAEVLKGITELRLLVEFGAPLRTGPGSVGMRGRSGESDKIGG